MGDIDYSGDEGGNYPPSCYQLKKYTIPDLESKSHSKTDRAYSVGACYLAIGGA